MKIVLGGMGCRCEVVWGEEQGGDGCVWMGCWMSGKDVRWIWCEYNESTHSLSPY